MLKAYKNKNYKFNRPFILFIHLISIEPKVMRKSLPQIKTSN